MKIYRTLASAAVDGFEMQHPEYGRYRRSLKRKKFWDANRLAERAYHGGRNEGYFIGRTQEHLQKAFVDIDFCACYPSVMALCPQIDIDGEVTYLSVRYRIDVVTVARLEKECIPAGIINEAKAALDKSLAAFDAYLKSLESKSLSYRLRQLTKVVDNSLIDSWQQRVTEACSVGSDVIESFLIPGFALVRFEFPEGTLFPCLPVRHPVYGLVYPLEGETYATAAEILLAIEIGASIEALASVEYPVALDGAGQPILFLLPHLKALLANRTAYEEDSSDPAAPALAKLCKEFINSFYGKFAQGVNTRRVMRVSDGLSESLGQSRITQVVIASLITGGARAALSALPLAAERYNRGLDFDNQIAVISATTDGALLGLPAPSGYSVVDDYYTWTTDAGQILPKFVGGKKLRLEDVFERFGCSEYFSILSEYLPIRQLVSARKALTGEDIFLELKHMADHLASRTTRFQIGYFWTGHCSLIAKGGLRPPLSDLYEDPEEYKDVMSAGGVLKNTKEAEWIIDQIERLEITGGRLCDYNFITLSGFKDILAGNAVDLVKQETPRVFHADFDWKRLQIYQNDPDAEGGKSISPFTLPHKNIAAMRKYRGVAQAIRKAGGSASAEKVLARVHRQDCQVWMRGGAEQSLTRMFLRGVVKGYIPVTQSDLSYKQMAELVNDTFAKLEVL